MKLFAAAKWVFIWALIAIPGGASAQQQRVAITTVWDLEHVYPTQAAWEAEQAAIATGLREIRRLKVPQPGSAAELRRLLDAVADVRGRAAKMAKVGTLQQLTATDSDAARRRQEEGVAIELRVEQEVAFLEPLLRRVGERRLMRWLAEDRRLGMHRRRILRTVRLARFAPPPGLEAIPAQISRWSTTMSDVYGSLGDSDLRWPEIALASGTERLQPASFARIMRSADARGRHRAAKAYLEHLAQYRELFGLLLARRIEADLQVARLRNLDDTIDQWLVTNDAILPQSYKAMFAGVREGREPLRKAAAALRHLHRLEQVRYSDIYAGAPSANVQFPLGDTVEPLLRAVAPLGSDYQALLRQRLGQSWLHLEPAPNKSSTVGVFWQVGGGHPHGLMIYRGDLASVRTLGGTALLMMAYASVPDELAPDRREEDLPIFSNAIWYLGFQLMDRALVETPGVGEAFKQEIRGVQLASLLRNYVRSAVLTELESRIGQRLTAGNAVTGDDISRLYRTLLDETFGAAGFTVDDHMAHEWMTFPALFSGPHYATFAISSATAVRLEDGLYSGDARMNATIREGIGRSDTHFSQDIVRGLGIDLATPALYSAANRRIGDLADAIVGARPN